MIFSLKKIDVKITSSIILGFNEPDHSKQSNLSVEEALENWHKLVSKSQIVGAPAMAGNPINGEWFPKFMESKPKVDFITVHWYKGVNHKKFIADMEKIHDKYNKPIWITEFAPQNCSSSKNEPEKFT